MLRYEAVLLAAKALHVALGDFIQAIELEHDKPAKHYGRKSSPAIDKLGNDLREQVRGMIMSPHYTYEGICAMLAEHGISLSSTSIARYRKRMLNDGLNGH